MILDPGRYEGVPAYQLLQSAGHGYIPVDRRLLHAILDYPENSLPDLLRASQIAAPPKGIINDPTFGRAKNILYVWLQGGPPQHETFDPKPDAPGEVRGDQRAR